MQFLYAVVLGATMGVLFEIFRTVRVMICHKDIAVFFEDILFLNNKKHIHFIGIGGSWMYPPAQILHTLGYYLTGSDNNETETLDAVRKMGCKVYMGQRAENIEGAELIVYTSAIMSDNPELIAAKESGVKISFVSNYNSGLVPVYERANLNGDMVLETELTSNFATVAPLREILTADQLAKAPYKYVSPDKVIDASTALFPDNTWFVKDAPHVAADYGSGFSDFTFALLESNVQPDVKTFAQYPQFMIADDTLSLSPLK